MTIRKLLLIGLLLAVPCFAADGDPVREGKTVGTTIDIGTITDNNIPKMGASGFEDSAVTDDGTTVTVGSQLQLSSTTLTATGPTDNLDVSAVNVVKIDTSSNNVTLGGLTGGVDGQTLFVVITDATNNTIVEHAESTGNQDIYLESAGDETKTATYGGWILECDGTHWYQTGGGGGGSGSGDLKADGTVPLTANWDVGAYTITGTQFISDIAIGTAPFVVTSTTEVANLKAATVGTITGLAPDTATTQATQPNVTTAANLVTVGALDSGSITSGFGAIDNGASAITTTGTVTAGALTVESNTVDFGDVTEDYVLTFNASTNTWAGEVTADVFDATAQDALTWSDGANASNVWTFDVSGTDPTMTFGDDSVAISGALTATSYGGITEANLVDKSAAETITGIWDFARYTSFTYANDTYNVGPFIRFYRSRDGDPTSNVADGDWLGDVRFSGNYGGYQIGAYIAAVVDGTPGASPDMPTELIFQTASDGSATPATRMSIKADGNVGINTTSPQSLLDVQGDAGAAGIATLATKELTVVATDELGRINFNAPLESDGTDAILPGASIWAVAEDTFAADNNATSLVLATGASGAATAKVTIESDGTTTVAGDVSATSFTADASATPSVAFTDSDTDDQDTSAQIYANATATGTGAEVVDMVFQTQGAVTAGAMGSFLTWDASAETLIHNTGTIAMSATDVACADGDDTCAYDKTYQWHRLTSGSDATDDTLTLAAGTIDGELRTFTLVSDGGDDAIIDVSTGTDTTLANAGDSVDYMWDATNSTWWIK